MEYYLMYHGGCGHTDVRQVPESVFEYFRSMGGRTRQGRRTSMVYVRDEPACYVCYNTDVN